MRQRINRTEMLNLFRTGDYSQRALAKMFDISPQNLSQILSYEMLPEERKQIKKLIQTKRKIKKLKESL